MILKWFDRWYDRNVSAAVARLPHNATLDQRRAYWRGRPRSAVYLYCIRCDAEIRRGRIAAIFCTACVEDGHSNAGARP